MKHFRVLDCTLRDGGYVNEFKFGKQVIRNIIDDLAKSSVDIIECGFLISKADDPDKSLFPSINAIREYIGEKVTNSMYVAMIQYGAIGIDEIDDYDGTSIDGIRLTFHEYEIDQAFVLGKQLIRKGYKVFMQPVGTTSYDDGALVRLIKRINILRPFAFYIVDTLGMMYKNDLLHMFYIADYNLDQRIALGFHSHNNLQMSFANAQELIQINPKRDLIIDSSVLGMGRGAGNLNTELLIQYFNVYYGLKYDVFRIMNIIDQYIRPLSAMYKWGYDPAYYLAAVTGCHPNYASFLLNMQTLQVKDIRSILNGLDNDKRDIFDKKYIQSEYVKYMDHAVDDFSVKSQLTEIFKNRKVLLLAPGKSLKHETDKINSLISCGKYVVMSVNFVPVNILPDFIFVSNLKRFNEIENNPSHGGVKMLITSNIIRTSNEYLIVNYSSYLNEDASIVDNAGMMCINLLAQIGVKDILLAGFDGFSENIRENFYEESLYLDIDQERLALMNIAISNKLKQLKRLLNIEFVSKSCYIND